MGYRLKKSKNGPEVRATLRHSIYIYKYNVSVLSLLWNRHCLKTIENNLWIVWMAGKSTIARLVLHHLVNPSSQRKLNLPTFQWCNDLESVYSGDVSSSLLDSNFVNTKYMAEDGQSDCQFSDVTQCIIEALKSRGCRPSRSCITCWDSQEFWKRTNHS